MPTDLEPFASTRLDNKIKNFSNRAKKPVIVALSFVLIITTFYIVFVKREALQTFLAAIVPFGSDQSVLPLEQVPEDLPELDNEILAELSNKYPAFDYARTSGVEVYIKYHGIDDEILSTYTGQVQEIDYVTGYIKITAGDTTRELNVNTAVVVYKVEFEPSAGRKVPKESSFGEISIGDVIRYNLPVFDGVEEHISYESEK